MNILSAPQTNYISPHESFLPASGNPRTGGHEIDRSGLYGLAGKLERDQPDPITYQVLEEIRYLPRLKPQPTLQEGMCPLKSQHNSRTTFTQAIDQNNLLNSSAMGLGTLNFSPMKLNWVYGRNTDVDVLNLTGLNQSQIVYAASNVVVIFDYYKNIQSVLQGHKNKIKCLTRDNELKTMASGDVGRDALLIIWNISTGFPIRIIPVTQGKENSGVNSIGYTGPNSSYVGLVEYGEVESITEAKDLQEGGSINTAAKIFSVESVSIWYIGEAKKFKTNHNLTRETFMEARLELPTKIGRQHHLVFSSDKPDHFITTGDKCVVFYTWLRAEQKILCHVPKGHRKVMGRLRNFTQSIWFGDSVLTTTMAGYIVEWKLQQPMGLEELPDPDLNVKEFRRYIKVDDYAALTSIVAHKNFIVIGDNEGTVRFLDTKFRILRLTKTINGQTINSLAFNSTNVPPEWKLELQKSYGTAGYEHDTFHREGHSTVYDYTFGGQKRRPPSEITLERKPLHAQQACLDLVVGYVTGSVAYFHIAEEKKDVLVPGTPGVIAALDASPTTSHFAISTQSGDVQIYDYNTAEIITFDRIFKKRMTVTYLKFHPSGVFLVFGTSKGIIYFRRVFTLGLIDNPLHIGRHAIRRIVFSSCGMFIGIYDDDMVVTLCSYNTSRQSWGIKGRHRSHYRPIVDICFFYDTVFVKQRFFSLGQDRRIVEYDLSQSSATKGLKISVVTFLEQLHTPTSMVFDSPFPNHGPLLIYSNSNNKIRFFDQDACKIRKTCQGPDYGANVNRMMLVAPDASFGRNTTFVLMVLGKDIGLMKTPIDGNPFKFMAVLGHPTPIKDVGIAAGGRDIFTSAEDDACVFMWNPDIWVLENSTLLGGPGVVPFKRYLDAGLEPGQSLVEDIENIFFHLMMKRVENQGQLLNMRLKIPLADIPTVMRTCGYFPSELEIDSMLEEVEFLLSLKYSEKPRYIGLDDFLILFANHRDTGIYPEDVIHAFKLLGEVNVDGDLCILRENFVTFITSTGEPLKEVDLPTFLPTFYRPLQEAALPVVLVAPWEIRSSNNSSSQILPVEDTASQGSDDAKRKLSTTSSTEPTGENSDSKILKFSEISGEFQGPEDAEVISDFAISMEMISTITSRFFIDQLLPPDVRDSLRLSQNEFYFDMEDLEKIGEEHPMSKSYNELINRWKGRDEWKYFKTLFDRLRHENIPMDRKLAAVIEMDYFCRRGSWLAANALDCLDVKCESYDDQEEEGEVSDGRDEGPNVMAPAYWITQEHGGVLKLSKWGNPLSQEDELEQTHTFIGQKNEVEAALPTIDDARDKLTQHAEDLKLTTDTLDTNSDSQDHNLPDVK